MSTLDDLLEQQLRGGASSTSHDKISRFAHSVLLKLPKFSKNYFPEDFIKGLDGIVERSEIRVLGRLKFPNEWTMTLSCEDARERLLQKGYFTVNRKKCIVHPMAENEIRGRVHWLPGELNDDKIRHILDRFGEVLSFKKEMEFRTPAELRSNVRSFSLMVKPGNKIDDIPHFIKIGNCEGLITIKNRDPICLGCKEHGHRKSVCPNTSKKFISKKGNKKREVDVAVAKETGTKKKKKAKKKPAEAAATAAAEPQTENYDKFAELQKAFESLMQQMSLQFKGTTSSANSNSQAAANTKKKPIFKKDPADPPAAGPSYTLQVVKKDPITKPELTNGSLQSNRAVSTAAQGGAVGGQVPAVVIAMNNANIEKVPGEAVGGGGKKKKKNKKKKVRFVAAE